MHDHRLMTLEGHLTELRTRITIIIAVLGVVFIGGFFGSRDILRWLIVSAPVPRIVVIGVPEAFLAVIQVDFILSLIAVSPLIMYEVTAFISPGLTDRERRFVGWIVGPGLLLFLGGMAVGFFVFVPLVLRVMESYIGKDLREMWTVSNYLSFVIYLTVPFGLLMEFPLASGLLARMGILDPKVLRKYRRYAVMVAFLIAAAIAPPDALSMMVIGSIMYLIYELSTLVAMMAYHDVESYDK